jgi:hypothetical protein
VVRKQFLEKCQLNVLPQAVALYGTTCERLSLYDGFEDCQNLVYDYEVDRRPMVLRISFRQDRPLSRYGLKFTPTTI